ncbi:DUF1439 domain-containing protein [Pandoraea apista]|uniref:DUF1439 domain-containing protein n=1 Tax=Pandoraea apista TaxID=93218 RepID=A0ABX9ZKL3_9BURK|nr:DUF1439 domain-containing protein [Pandoraea apista]AVF41741.1 DUF1439 domain-containing protein [Pandoraea apista]PTD98873.1 DUF1439 domain-containing protein [Pandoraea apista]RRJ31911.1 DUF1439 domain-containing protein [Pandoraea apista]RRJ80069.1 DUF1439 domain-containing protein [Pandoraea apista]RSD06926.1 DUF1439 domain-containing protein [Pandoraea apista]
MISRHQPFPVDRFADNPETCDAAAAAATSRRDALRLAAAGLLGLTLAPLTRSVNAAYNIWTGEYTMTRKEIETAIDKRFPTTLNYGQLLSVALAHPQIGFNPQANRITTQVDAQVQNVLLQGQPLAGVLAISSALKYDPVKRAVLLDNPSVDRVDLNGMPASYGQQLTSIGGTVAQQVLNQYPIYTFKPEQLRYGGREVEPGAITVLPDGIKVEVKTK